LANGGFGTINGGLASADSDQDGMPDFWEIATGSNPLVADNNTVAADGYTLLEHYINWLAAPHATTVTNTPVSVDLSQYTGGFTGASPVYSANNTSHGTIVLNSGHIVQFTPASNFFGLGSFNFSVVASDGSIMTNTVTICITGKTSIPSVPTGLTALAANNQVALSWTASTGAMSYNVKRSTTSGSGYTTLTSLTTTSYTDTTPVNGTTYYYVVSAVNTGGESANSSQVSAIPATLPSPWATVDIGAVGVAGFANYGNGLFTVKGSGADIWGAADAFRYVYQPANGDCSIQAKVLSVQNTAAWAKAGVMVRETTNANSTCALVFLAPVTGTTTNGVAFQQRTTTGGATTSITSKSGLQAPYWVRLDRTGNSFVGYYSADGTSWTALATNSITMATNVYIGLPVCSVVNGTLNTATFTNVTANP
jgi:fibronectin type 3 domain-containing protein